jgi:2-methylcitrate dehydratase PrpD
MPGVQDWLVATAFDSTEPSTEQAERVIAIARDIGGVMVAGSRTEAVDHLQAYLDATSPAGPVPVIGSAVRRDPVGAALANGSAAQALDYDDIAPSCVSHLGAIMVPAMLSFVHEMDADRAIAGYVRGLCAVDRLAEAFTHDIYDRGIQPTHTCAPIGAVVALVHALRLTEGEARNAFGLLATQLIGLRDHTGTRYKAVQAGVAAAAAVRSVLLARAGISAGHRAVDVVFGLLGVDETSISRLGRDGLPAPVPVAPKAFPTCGASHTAIEATLALREKWPDPGEPEVTIEVTCPPQVMVALEFDRPASPDEGRFSLPYPVAVAWRYGHVGPQSFAPGALEDPSVAALMDRVKITVDAALSPPPTWSGSPAQVEVRSRERAATCRIDRPLGYPERPMSNEQLDAKFLGCTAHVLGDERAAAALAGLRDGDVFANLGGLLTP